MDMRGQNSRIARLFKESKQELDMCGIKYSKNINPEIRLNRRYMNTLGICYKEDNEYRIELNANILKSPDRKIKEILLHELIHTCYGCMNHGKNFKARAKRINERFGYNVKRETDTENLIYNDTKQ